MLGNTSEEGGFGRFLEANAAFFDCRSKCYSNTPGSILVDLCHDNPCYLHINCITAKYLQRSLGGRLVGVFKSWPGVLLHSDFRKVRDFALSFGFSEVIDLDYEVGALRSTPECINSEVPGMYVCSSLTGEELRRFLLQFQQPDAPDIGRIVYDTALRSRRIATLEAADECLIRCALEVWRLFQSMNDIVARFNVKATVVGHLDYAPYAVMCAASLLRGAAVFFSNILIPVSIQSFRSLDAWRSGVPEGFLGEFRKVQALWRQKPANRAAARFDQFCRRFAAARQTLPKVAVTSIDGDRRAILARLGLDPNKPTVGILVNALSDSVHLHGAGLFCDFGQWLLRTVEQAENIPDVNFLVKPHPQNDAYETSGFVQMLVRRYEGAENLVFVEAALDNKTLARCIDHVVTVCGTPGYELPIQGVHAIAAGPSRYAGLSFCTTPATTEEYFALLKDNHSWSPLSEAEKLEALEFGLFEISALKNRCCFVPSMRKVGTSEYWADAVESLELWSEEEDPFFRNLTQMIQDRSPVLLNGDLLS